MNMINRQLALAVLLPLLLLSSQIAAEEKKYLLQPGTYDVLSNAQADMEKLDYGAAKQKLDKLLAGGKLKDYDKAVSYQTLGYVENGLGNFQAAAAAFEKALSLNTLPEKVTHTLLYSTAQILIHIEKPEAGLKYLAKWFANEPKPQAEAHIVAAAAYYQTKNFEQLIFHVEKALSLSAEPPLSWYELLLAAYYETKKLDKAAALLETILTAYPDKKDYWLQLAGIYQQLKQEKKALAIYELAYTRELLEKDDILLLVKSYLYLEMPYKAGSLLEKELAIGDLEDNQKSLQLLVDSWLLAQETEKAESVLRELVKRFNDIEARLRLAQLYVDTAQWQKTVELLDTKFTVEDENLKSKLNLLLGVARYYQDNMGKASSAFTRALSSKETEEQARWWLRHIEEKAAENSQS